MGVLSGVLWTEKQTRGHVLSYMSLNEPPVLLFLLLFVR